MNYYKFPNVPVCTKDSFNGFGRYSGQWLWWFDNYCSNNLDQHFYNFFNGSSIINARSNI